VDSGSGIESSGFKTLAEGAKVEYQVMTCSPPGLTG